MPALKVLFVCVGNAYRSQIAEGLARKLGADLLTPSSAGLFPVDRLPALTVEILADRGVDASGQHPKGLDEIDPDEFDLVIDMAGVPLAIDFPAEHREWDVPDPVGRNRAFHEAVADEIEMRVRALIDELRLRRS